MNFYNLLQDPLVVIELMAVFSTFIVVTRFALMPSQDSTFIDFDSRALQSPNSSHSDSSSIHNSQSAGQLLDLFPVGSLISLPKRSLAQQSLN